MVGLTFELLLIMLALGDVLHGAFVADELAAGASHHVRVLGYPDACAIAPIDLGLEVEHLALLLHQLAEHFATPTLDVQATLYVSEIGHQFGRTVVSVNARQRRIGGQIAAIAGGLENALRSVLEDAAITQFGLFQRFEHGLLGGDVLDEALHHDLALLIGHRDAALDDPFEAPRGGADPVMHGESPHSGDSIIDAAADAKPVIRMGDPVP